MRRISLIIIFLLSVLSNSYGQDISKHKKEKLKIQQEISNIDRQLRNTQNKKKASLNNLALVQNKIEKRKELISQITLEINNLNRQILIKENDINRLQNRLDTLSKYYERLVYKSYRNRDKRIWFMYIFSSNDISQGLRRWSYLKNISTTIKNQANKITATKEIIFLEKNKLDNLRKEAIISKENRIKEYQKLNQEELYANNTIYSLKTKEKQYRKELQKKKGQIEKINKQIERILAEAVRQQKKAGSKVKIDYELSAKFSDNKGKLPWPTHNGIVVEKFGQSYHPVFRNIKLPFNNGIDISNNLGAEAIAVFNGIVKQVLIMPGYNQCVLIQHGEYFTFYCKLKKVSVKSGQNIKTGDSIGIIDNSEGNTILHFELWKGTSKQNPEQWLKHK